MSQTQGAPAALNYDPTDPDKMRLPKGVTCGDCVHIYRCKSMFGHTEADTYCDWSPSRFRAADKNAPQQRTCVGCGKRHPFNPDGTPEGGALPCGH